MSNRNSWRSKSDRCADCHDAKWIGNQSNRFYLSKKFENFLLFFWEIFVEFCFQLQLVQNAVRLSTVSNKTMTIRRWTIGTIREVIRVYWNQRLVKPPSFVLRTAIRVTRVRRLVKARQIRKPDRLVNISMTFFVDEICLIKKKKEKRNFLLAFCF